MMNMNGLNAFMLSAVTFKDSYQVNAFKKEVSYLLSIDPDRLLAGFRETAGLSTKGAARYPGWENMLIGGHTLGHYMTACVNCCESANIGDTQHTRLLGILKELTDGLRECQLAAGTGFIFGARLLDIDNIELQFDNVELGKTQIFTEAWVPWYTMHKIFEGLCAVANMNVGEMEYTAASVAQNAHSALPAEPAAQSTEPATQSIAQTARLIASDLADWVYRRTSSWSKELHDRVLATEYGGMNDCLYEVYLLTGKTEHLEAAKAFDEIPLFERVLAAKSGDNVLNNLHANTTIPKFIGALRRFTVTHEQRFFDYASAFWQLVVENHTYITGDNSEWEHFGADRVLNAERTSCNCETCNAYNMLKLTRMLFMITGKVMYSDWYENTFINTILSSQNPDTGMTTYFQPMAGGYFKVYGERFTKFWCCIGSGMENFSKLQEGFYFHKDRLLIVNEYFSSSLDSEVFGLVQTADLGRSNVVHFRFTKKHEGSLAFRLPEWLAGPATIRLNGQIADYRISSLSETSADSGYAVIEGPFADGCELELTLPMKITAHNLPDSENTYAFKFGPFVLSARLGNRDMVTSTTGVDVTVPKDSIFEAKYLSSQSERIAIASGTVAEFIEAINEHMLQFEDNYYSPSFRLTGTDSNLIFVPHYMQHTERYGIYFEFSGR